MQNLYELTPSQDVVELQCKYTLFKRIINILSSASQKEKIDFDLMQKAFNQIIVRNDCLRIKFVKKDGRLMQYFDEPFTVEIPRLSFNTKEEQEKFINSYKVKKIPYRKGKVFDVKFIKTYDNRYMVMMKVTHTILDIYGLGIVYKDLFEVYNALKNGTDLPVPPTSFEETVKKDVQRKFSPEYLAMHKKFYEEFYATKEEPYYIGIHGEDNPIWQKQLAKNKHSMKMFFLANQTEPAKHEIPAELVIKVMDFCKEHACSPENFFFYAYNLTSAYINNKTKHAMNLALYNCRGTVIEKKTGGTKAQSLAVYLNFDYNKSFIDNFNEYMETQNLLNRHIGFPDVQFESILNNTYRKPMLDTFYSATFSFIPMVKPRDVEIEIYSNGRFVLPSYIALMFDVETNKIEMLYDYQKKILTAEQVANFHKKYLSVMEKVLDNPELLIDKVA